MSQLSEREVVCPYCKQPVPAEVWSAINVKEDPELKDLLLGGEINITDCTACKEQFHVDTFVLYHDPDGELIGFVFPDDPELTREMMEEKMKTDFDATQATLDPAERLPYAPQMFVGLNELAAFVEREEEVVLQGEVFEAIAQDKDVPMRRLRPASARAQKLPRVLPFDEAPGLSPKDAVISGLKRLKTINDRLTVYNEALDRLSSDASARVSLS